MQSAITQKLVCRYCGVVITCKDCVSELTALVSAEKTVGGRCLPNVASPTRWECRTDDSSVRHDVLPAFARKFFARFQSRFVALLSMIASTRTIYRVSNPRVTYSWFHFCMGASAAAVLKTASGESKIVSAYICGRVRVSPKADRSIQSVSTCQFVLHSTRCASCNLLLFVSTG